MPPTPPLKSTTVSEGILNVGSHYDSSLCHCWKENSLKITRWFRFEKKISFLLFPFQKHCLWKCNNLCLIVLALNIMYFRSYFRQQSYPAMGCSNVGMIPLTIGMPSSSMNATLSTPRFRKVSAISFAPSSPPTWTKKTWRRYNGWLTQSSVAHVQPGKISRGSKGDTL